MDLGSHNLIVIVGSFNLNFSFPIHIDPVKGHACCSHSHISKFQETKTPFVIYIDGQNRVLIILFLFSVSFCSGLLDRIPEEVVKFLFVDVRRQVSYVQTTSMSCLLGHRAEVAASRNPSEICCTRVGCSIYGSFSS